MTMTTRDTGMDKKQNNVTIVGTNRSCRGFLRAAVHSPRTSIRARRLSKGSALGLLAKSMREMTLVSWHYLKGTLQFVYFSVLCFRQTSQQSMFRQFPRLPSRITRGNETSSSELLLPCLACMNSWGWLFPSLMQWDARSSLTIAGNPSGGVRPCRGEGLHLFPTLF